MRRGARARGGGCAVAAIACAVLGLCGATRPAEAYVRYRTSTNEPFAWPQTCVPITVYPLSMKDVNGNMDLTSDQIVHAVSASASAWSIEQNPCSFLTISVAPSTGATPIARYDNKNSVVFRTSSWCAPGDPVDMCSYSPAALAITSVFANKTTGLIRDADIEVNSLSFIWTDLDLAPTDVVKQDLQNALTHEMGHLIGLNHTCYLTGEEPLIDEDGLPQPHCDDASPAVRATTMFASADPGDLTKRTLAPDDKRAVCEMYPIAKDPQSCGDRDDGCSVAPVSRSGEGAPTFAALAALGALVAATRRRARGR